MAGPDDLSNLVFQGMLQVLIDPTDVTGFSHIAWYTGVPSKCGPGLFLIAQYYYIDLV